MPFAVILNPLCMHLTCGGAPGRYQDVSSLLQDRRTQKIVGFERQSVVSIGQDDSDAEGAKYARRHGLKLKIAGGVYAVIFALRWVKVFMLSLQTVCMITIGTGLLWKRQ